MRYAELFAGIGGLGAGFAPFGRCVWANENDAKARDVYAANHPGVPLDGRNVREVSPDEAPDVDVLCGGFPCQSFSSLQGAGARSHGADPADEVGVRHPDRGALWREFLRWTEAKRPAAVLMENVKGLLRENRGGVAQALEAGFRALGYGFSARVVNARAWTPQNRERLFMVALSGGAEPDWGLLEEPPEADWPTLADALDFAWEPPEGDWSWWKASSVERWHREREARLARKAANGRDNALSLLPVAAVPEGRSRCLTGNASDTLYVETGGGRRKLTVAERKRLMGFPDAFRLPVSNNKAVRLLANAVVPAVARAVAEAAVLPHARRVLAARGRGRRWWTCPGGTDLFWEKAA